MGTAFKVMKTCIIVSAKSVLLDNTFLETLLNKKMF